jgi:hypothetical protein
MIEVLKVVSRDLDSKKARCILGADSLDELQSEELEIVNLPVGYDLDFFSRCLDKTGAVAIYDSTGEWNVVE